MKKMFAMLLAGSLAAIGMNTSVNAQTYAQGYTQDKSKKGLLLDGEVMEPGARYAMNGYVISHQEDGNLCLKTQADYQYRWCTTDVIGGRYADITKVVFEKGTLKALGNGGEVIWSTPPKQDPYALVLITPDGELQVVNAAGGLYWSNK